MKHNVDYKFSDQITSVKNFFEAVEDNYSIGTIEKRDLNNDLISYQLTIYSEGDGPNVQYELYTLDDCLQIATSRVDFMYHLSKRGYLVVVG